MQRLSIIIPAHNEEKRIGRTLQTYGAYFNDLQRRQQLEPELVVVLNGCSDGTTNVVQALQQQFPFIRMIDVPDAGKGLAIKIGFQDALTRNNDLIGFVDADMATAPEYFYELVQQLPANDTVIASRYMRDSQLFPPRPFIKEWGRKIIYHGLIRLMFGLWQKDLQCGAKVFKRAVLETVTPLLTVRQWAFDVELLYLCKRHNFSIKEIPTTWHDQADSKLKVMRSGMRMLGSLFKMRWHHFFHS